MRLPPVGLAVGEVPETRRAAHGVLHLGQQFPGRVYLGVEQLGGGAGQSAGHAAPAPLLLILFDGLGDGGFHEVLVVFRQAGMLLRRRAILPRPRLPIRGAAADLGGALPIFAAVTGGIAIAGLAFAVALTLTLLVAGFASLLPCSGLIVAGLFGSPVGLFGRLPLTGLLLLGLPGGPFLLSCSAARCISRAKYSSAVLLRGRPSLAGVIPSSGQRGRIAPERR